MSHATAEARREYQRAWRARHPEYRRAWYVAHAMQERARIKAWRLANPEKWRTSRKHYPRPVLPMPGALHTGHALFEIARSLAGRDGNDGLLAIHRPLVEDLRSEAVLALLEGRDPVAAVTAYRRIEQAWQHVTAPMLYEL